MHKNRKIPEIPIRGHGKIGWTSKKSILSTWGILKDKNWQIKRLILQLK